MKTRRALSSVVGMVFAIIALSSTFAYISYSMNTLSTYNQSVVQKNQQLADVNKEKFQITSVTFANAKFNITVVNTGNLPINFTKIWIQNMSTTNWDHSYVPTNSFVSPGGIVKNIGQSLSKTIDSTKSYNLMLVTSRGNTQQFTVNSASAAPLNIQLLTMPPTLPSGFTTQLVMIVTNNSTGVLANVIPTTQKVTSGSSASTASCTIGALSSNSYPTLQIGQTAVFSWPLTIIGNPSQICTYTAQLQGSSQTVQATVTSTVVSLVPATTYSQYSGILTINYTSFRWAASGQGTIWNTGWQFPSVTNTAFKINMTNNNSTGTFYLSKNTVLVYFASRISPSLQPTKFYIVNSTNPATMGTTAYTTCNGQTDYCLKVLPGQTVTVYFASTTVGGNGAQQFPGPDVNSAFLLAFGKFASSQTSAGTLYAQNIPYIAAIVT
jgi:hypothetical protein